VFGGAEFGTAGGGIGNKTGAVGKLIGGCIVGSVGSAV